MTTPAVEEDRFQVHRTLVQFLNAQLNWSLQRLYYYKIHIQKSMPALIFLGFTHRPAPAIIGPGSPKNHR